MIENDITIESMYRVFEYLFNQHSQPQAIELREKINYSLHESEKNAELGLCRSRHYVMSQFIV